MRPNLYPRNLTHSAVLHLACVCASASFQRIMITRVVIVLVAQAATALQLQRPPPDVSTKAPAPSRRALISTVVGGGAALAVPGAAQARSSTGGAFKDANWPLWPALPLAPYSRRKTIRREVGPGVWAFEQLLGVFYVHVPIRMTVIAMETGGLFVYGA